MTKEHDKYLVETYPLIFKNRYASMTQTAMCWGFECGDGWFDLINALCGCIQSFCTNNPSLCGQVVASQVKEKYGKLRFYVESSTEMIDGMIWLAEYQSGRICEECGKLGEIVDDYGWYMCRCPEHSPLESIKDEDVIIEG